MSKITPEKNKKTISGLHLKLIGLVIKQLSSNVGNFSLPVMHISKCSQKTWRTAGGREQTLDDRELDAVLVEAVD